VDSYAVTVAPWYGQNFKGRQVKHILAIDLEQMMRVVWASLLRYDSETDIPVNAAWIVLCIVSGLCLWLLARRIRAFEVIK
jgi:hypothetical protein